MDREAKLNEDILAKLGLIKEQYPELLNPDFAIDSTAILNYFKYKRLLDLFSLNIKNYAYSRKIFSNTRLFCN